MDNDCPECKWARAAVCAAAVSLRSIKHLVDGAHEVAATSADAAAVAAEAAKIAADVAADAKDAVEIAVAHRVEAVIAHGDASSAERAHRRTHGGDA